jgi:hypothetical protein
MKYIQVISLILCVISLQVESEPFCSSFAGQVPIQSKINDDRIKRSSPNFRFGFQYCGQEKCSKY